MKKHLLIILTALTLSAASQAQTGGLSLPYSCDFENASLNVLWNLVEAHGNNKWVIASGADHGNCLFVSSDNGQSNSYSTSSTSLQLAYVDVVLPYDSSYMASFDWRCYGETAHDFVRLALIPDSCNLSNLSYMHTLYANDLPEGWIAIDGGAKYRSSTWKSSVQTAEAEAGNYRLALIWVNDGSGGVQPPAAIDNIELKLVTCPSTTRISAFSTTTSTAEVDWSATSTATSWIVEYGLQGFEQGSGLEETTTSTHHTITGLSAAQRYDIYVRPICAGADTGLSAKTSVTTSCYDGGFADYPFTEGFEGDYGCWSQQVLSGGATWTSTSALSNGTTPFEGTKCITFESQNHDGNSAMLITPILNLEDADSAILRFAHIQPSWGADQDELSVAYRIHPDSAWRYVWNWNSNIASWQQERLVLPQLSGTLQIAFVGLADYGRGIGIDEVMVIKKLPCTAPTLVGEQAESGSITLTWEGNGLTQYVSIKESGTETWAEEAETEETTFTFIELTADTRYDIRIRQECEEGMSDYIQTSISTLPEPQNPECGTAENIMVYATTNAATVIWKNESGVDSWDLIYFKMGQTQGSSEIISTENHQYRLTGLTPKTYYGVSIRTRCSDGKMSSWSKATKFLTGVRTSGIEEAGNNALRMYPNPASKSVWIELGEDETNGTELELADMLGRTAKTIRLTTKTTLIDLSGLARGVYLVKILGGDTSVYAGKLIVE